MNHSVVVSIAIALSLPLSGHADMVYNDFGPGGSFSTSSGWAVSGTTSANGLQTSAMSFISPGNYSLDEIDVALRLFSGTGAAQVSLWSANGVLPDVQLGSWSTGVTSSPAVASITGITGLSLSAGQSYFLEVAAGAPDTFATWFTTDQNVRGTVDLLHPNGWTTLLNSTPATFAIQGTLSPVPLPAAAWLLLSGLGGLGAFVRNPRWRAPI